MWVQLAVAVALVAGAIAVAPSPEPALQVPEHRGLRAGDAAAYEMDLSGGWHFDGLADQVPLPGPRLEVRAPELVTRADGMRVHAFPVATQALATTLLPGPDAWSTFHGTQWLDGVRVATAGRGTSSLGFGIESRADDDRVWTYPDGLVGDCLLSRPVHGRPCDLPYLRLHLDGAPLQDLGAKKSGGAALHHLRADDGTTRVDWWFAPDIPFPVRLEATMPGAPGLPERVLKLRLSGFLEGHGTSEVLASSFAPSPLAWAPRQPWGPQEGRIDVPLPLSAAYEAAWSDPGFPDLRRWMMHHDGYVFMAEPSRSGQRWDVHLSDGREGFSFQARLASPLLPLEERRIELAVIEPSPLAASAPSRADAPVHLPTVASLWARWHDHAEGGLQRLGANVWAFRMLEGPDGVVTHLAAGRATGVAWDPLGAILGPSDAAAASGILVLDGHGDAIAYRASHGSHPGPAASPPYTPQSLPHIAAAWPWSPSQTGAGVAAAAALALLLPKLALALFTRFRPDELLEHPMRAMILDAVRAEPGLHFRALCSRLGAQAGRVRHHVRKLVEGGHLIQRVSPGYTCYFPHDGTPRSLLQTGPLIRSEGARNLIGCLASRPGANAKELAQLAGLSPATATYHLKRLQEAGAVAAQRDGRCLRLHLTPDGMQALAAMG